MDYHTSISSASNGSYSFMFNPYADEMPNPRKDVLMKLPVVFNDMRLTLYIEGQFGENEGIDSEIICRFNYNYGGFILFDSEELEKQWKTVIHRREDERKNTE